MDNNYCERNKLNKAKFSLSHFGSFIASCMVYTILRECGIKAAVSRSSEASNLGETRENGEKTNPVPNKGGNEDAQGEDQGSIIEEGKSGSSEASETSSSKAIKDLYSEYKDAFFHLTDNHKMEIESFKKIVAEKRMEFSQLRFCDTKHTQKYMSQTEFYKKFPIKTYLYTNNKIPYDAIFDIIIDHLKGMDERYKQVQRSFENTAIFYFCPNIPSVGVEGELVPLLYWTDEKKFKILFFIKDKEEKILGLAQYENCHSN